MKDHRVRDRWRDVLHPPPCVSLNASVAAQNARGLKSAHGLLAENQVPLLRLALSREGEFWKHWRHARATFHVWHVAAPIRTGANAARSCTSQPHLD
jgi:hypothetical protein